MKLLKQFEKGSANNFTLVITTAMQKADENGSKDWRIRQQLLNTWKRKRMRYQKKKEIQATMVKSDKPGI